MSNQAQIEMLERNAISSAAEVYQRYQHLDAMLSDQGFMGNDFRAMVLVELWEVVKPIALSHADAELARLREGKVMIEHITYTSRETDILDDLHEEADLQRDGSSGASNEELADLLERAARELQHLREVELKALAQSEDVQRNWLSPVEAEGLRQEIVRLRATVREYAEPKFYDPGNNPLPWQLAQDVLKETWRKT